MFLFIHSSHRVN